MRRILCVLLVAGLAFLGFPLDEAISASAQGSKDWPSAISISTPPVATGAYGVNVALCSLISKYLNVPCTVEGTPGDRAGVTILAKKEAEFTNASALPAWEAYRGIGEFAQLGKTPLRLVAGCHAVYVHLATLEGSGIKSIEDIRGKRFMYLNPGAVLLYTSAEAILDAYGLKGDVKVLKTAGLKPSIDALMEGRADVIAYPSGLGAGPFIELSTTKPTRFLPVDKAAIEKIQEKSPFFSGESLPAGTYKGQDKEVLCLVLRASTVTRADVPESFVYSVVKTLWEHLDEFRTLHTAAKEWAVEDILDLRVIPWHPGVIRYYKERGLWTPELDKAQSKLLSEGK
ncbi:MAG: TAXI family TRAP transporter solute-binding subunit [Desulfobacterales bacterium]|nr:TAXI family TRAP transporter solute-binding subunit [Desulfobacterales bacterium]